MTGSASAQPYWYYCDPVQAYYPYVTTCSVPWRAVTPNANPYSQPRLQQPAANATPSEWTRSAAQAISQDATALTQCITANMKGPYSDAHETGYNFCRGEVDDWLHECQENYYYPNFHDPSARAKCELALRHVTDAIDTQRKKERIESGTLTPSEIQERQNEADRLAARAGKPNTETVVSVGSAGVVPGTIICPDYRTVEFMIEWYKTYWADSFQDAITPPGQARLLRGSPTPAPNFKQYGCALLAPGMQMNLERGNIVPVVTAKLPDGTTIRGVTDPSMIGR